MVKCKKSFGTYPSLLFDSKLSIIGGSMNNNHLIWNDGTESFLINSIIWDKPHSSHCSIHASKKNALYVLSGHFSPFKRTDEIWRHESDTKLWSKMSIKLPIAMNWCPGVITYDNIWWM